ncbi:glycine-rich domain-containing protein [Azospirillum thermophilum]|uniref:Uncharacterized protein n=1 Tax=Azospirillum thermophilum TaxID=2202148 RepID=A0A2S2CMG4_9PROT|nr:hypothetical protein [Azospirillum thermophilum]AWK85703.1 hypothetical protein DEW08_05575 [Azospirillum thermophilum]
MTEMGADFSSEQAESLDLSFINKRLERAGRTPDEATRSVEEYRRFIQILAADPSKVLVPTKLADIAWHEHILFMENYENDMLRMVGGKVYHYPEVSNCPEWHNGIRNTQDAFHRTFGKKLNHDDFALCLISVKGH